mgnify:CR=1 FL=1
MATAASTFHESEVARRRYHTALGLGAAAVLGVLVTVAVAGHFVARRFDRSEALIERRAAETRAALDKFRRQMQAAERRRGRTEQLERDVRAALLDLEQRLTARLQRAEEGGGTTAA